MRETIEFDPNVPQRVALQYSTGRIVDGRNGQRVMFSLVDGRVMFLDLEVAEQVNQLRPKPGETLTVCKSKSGRETAWFVEREPRSGEQGDGTFAVPAVKATAAVPAAAAANAASQPHHNNGSNGSIPVNGNGNHAAPAPPTPPAPRTQLEDALRTVVFACHQARLYAKEIGYEAMPPFTSEDIRTMANTILIQRGGR
jgi:hypothetical protein